MLLLRVLTPEWLGLSNLPQFKVLMSVPYSFLQDSDRFISHRSLSITPKSTTIFKKLFDLQTGKYHNGFKINKETGEHEQDENGNYIQSDTPIFKEHKGHLSDKARRQLQRSVHTLISLVNPEIHINGKDKEQLTFCTLTLPSSQIKQINTYGIEYYATDKEIKSNCLNQLLTELREKQLFNNYVQVAEKQLNGSIHFHIVFDKRIDYELIRRRWNSLINKYGFVDRYAEKMRNLSKQEYIDIRLKEKSKLPLQKRLEKITNAWNYGTSTNWLNPNSTDIEDLKHVENVASYIAKYMSKEYGHTENERIATISKLAGNIEISSIVAKWFYQIEGRIWSCSQDISKTRRCVIEAETEYISELEVLVQNIKDTKIFVDDTFTTICYRTKDLYTYCQQIFNVYASHFKNYINRSRCMALDNDWVSFFTSLLPDLAVYQYHQESTTNFKIENQWQNELSLQ